jgi:hypothetical protein
MHPRVENLQVAWASPFRSVHCNVCIPNDLFGGRSMITAENDPDARRRVHGLPAHLYSVSYLLLDAPGRG